MFALAVGVGQATTRLDLPQTYLLAGYTLLAVVATLVIDTYSGIVLAAFGLVVGAHILGFIGHFPKVIAGEIMLALGMLICGLSGPSGGLWSGNRPFPADRHHIDDMGNPESVARTAVPTRKAD